MMGNIMNQVKRKDVDYHEPLPNINIDMKLATHILQDEVCKGSSGKNVVCSPLSLEFALHTVAAGSKGDTLLQILQFIGSKGNQVDSMEDLNLKSSAIKRVASSDHQKPELSFVNGVWVDKDYPLKPSYKELMTSVYNAKAKSVDFRKHAGKITRDINSWVADKTKNLIKEIVEPGSICAETVLILVNALYFKGLWDDYSEFDKDMTVDRDFHLLDGSKISVPFMSRSSPRYLFRAFDGFKVLQLNYQSGDDDIRKFCMQILLPDERDGLQNLIDKCVSDPGFLHQDFGLKFERLKELWVPKFKFTYTLDNLVGMMENLGVTLPFKLDCQDLTEMAEIPKGGSLYVSKILHKATVEVNESSTEAAAVTVVTHLPSSCRNDISAPPPVRFVADHPFMFVIKEVKTGAIFFVGAVFNPFTRGLKYHQSHE